jgi:CheY-like chemotaxis protein
MKKSDSTILLVEDNDDDVFAIKRALTRGQIVNPLQVVTTGQMALDYLSGSGKYADRQNFPLPFIIFLDLKLPYIGGFEVLTWMRQQSALGSIIVVILTSSDEEKDHQRACSLGARSYLVKPATPKDLVEVLASFKDVQLTSNIEAII